MQLFVTHGTHLRYDYMYIFYWEENQPTNLQLLHVFENLLQEAPPSISSRILTIPVHRGSDRFSLTQHRFYAVDSKFIGICIELDMTNWIKNTYDKFFLPKN